MARFRMQFLHARRSAVIAAALVALLALAGCESGTQEPDAPDAEGVEFGAAPMPAADPPESAAVPSRPTGDGSIDSNRFPEELPEGAEAAIPSNFPSTMPVYPSATPAMGMSGEVNDGERSAVQLLTNDSPADVRAFYEGNLDAGGWEITETQELMGNTSITAKSDCGTTMILLRADAGGGTDIYQVTEGC